MQETLRNLYVVGARYAFAGLLVLLATGSMIDNSSLLLAQQEAASPAAETFSVPRLIRFNGTLVDGRGWPITTPVSVVFAIYSQANGDEKPLWQETQQLSPGSKGGYTALLGSASSTGIPVEIFKPGESQYLAVKPEGEPEQPRVLLVSVPYALKASDAATLGGLPPSAFALVGTKPSPLSALAAAITPDAATTVTTTGGTANKLAKFSGANTIVNSILYDNGTEVGIGTTTPTATLDVVGTTSLNGDVAFNGSSTYKGELTFEPTNTASASAGHDSQALKFYASAYNSANNTAVNPRFYWQAEPQGNNTAAPTGTLNLLASRGTNSAAETGFYFNPNGTVHFATGQTFPGSGSITSVGLSAPTSDFTVSGSPVTGAGTLGLNWKIAPNSFDTANSLVKRDSTGSFVAGAITANLGILANSGSIAVQGTGNIGVWGQSNGSNGGSDGVHGVTGSAGASGVAGVNNAGGVGVYGTGGVGVFGTGSSFGMVTDSNVQQARIAGGWIKAMVEVDGPSSSINRCFNSTLAGAAATTPPCGIDLEYPSTGHYVLNFNFEVDDRFYTTQILYDSTLALALYRDGTNSLSVWSHDDAAGDLAEADYQLIIY